MGKIIKSKSRASSQCGKGERESGPSSGLQK
nr:MAG TPA: hypothetical protein [Caudoviricetes sp.]